jgi:hypothetical protein
VARIRSVPADPLTYLAAIAVLAGAAVVASYIPARIEPMSALKTD